MGKKESAFPTEWILFLRIRVMSLDKLLKGRKIIACCGSGGVGKTTMSATIGLKAAMAGMKVLVLTIDPARRLANSLGLSEMGNEQTRIKIPAKNGGELWGMMIDTKRVSDDLIIRISPNKEVRDRILNNHFYIQSSNAMAGSEEYMAMEKLYEITTRDEFDLVVLDTPPTKHALDFLDAPRRMAEFMDGRVIQWFVKPYMMAGKFSFGFAQKGAGLIFKILERVAGSETMKDLAEFFLAFDGLYDGFKDRAQAVHELMSGGETAFVIVTTPQRPALDEAIFFRDRLRESQIPLGAVVFNRIQESVNVDDVEKELASAEKIIEKIPKYASVIDTLIDLSANTDKIARAQRGVIEGFIKGMKGESMVYRVPALASDVHDIPSLLKVGEFITA